VGVADGYDGSGRHLLGVESSTNARNSRTWYRPRHSFLKYGDICRERFSPWRTNRLHNRDADIKVRRWELPETWKVFLLIIETVPTSLDPCVTVTSLNMGYCLIVPSFSQLVHVSDAQHNHLSFSPHPFLSVVREVVCFKNGTLYYCTRPASLLFVWHIFANLGSFH
jgi:hypothetical protein